MGCGVLCAVDPHAVGAWGVGSAVGITPSEQPGPNVCDVTACWFGLLRKCVVDELP